MNPLIIIEALTEQPNRAVIIPIYAVYTA